MDMAYLVLFPFTPGNDDAVANESLEPGWLIQFGEIVNTLSGNDSVTGNSERFDGIANSGALDTGAGDDNVTGIGIDAGIKNFGTIDTGDGNDCIRGNGSGNLLSYGIRNFGTIDTGTGNDSVIGETSAIDPDPFYTPGIDSIGLIDTGAGNDSVIGISRSTFGIISNGIYTGIGSDNVTGSGPLCGISNFGTIDTGAGADMVDALVGGFGGPGSTTLGIGRDTLKGFGTGNFYGGIGTDKILFGEGTYVISGSTITKNDIVMNVFEFEKVGGANGGLFTFADGTLIVDGSGVVTSFS